MIRSSTYTLFLRSNDLDHQSSKKKKKYVRRACFPLILQYENKKKSPSTFINVFFLFIAGKFDSWHERLLQIGQ